jgi:light-independent protochlorophyllide reductase subunit B
MGFEGVNVLFDAWVHPLMMGLEEHLLAMFCDDFEFSNAAAPSHLGTVSHGDGCPASPTSPITVTTGIAWAADAEQELHKVPFFVRGKARRNAERFAIERGVATITVETLYDAKAHFGR